VTAGSRRLAACPVVRGEVEAKLRAGI
jgi:hypothetical protein